MPGPKEVYCIVHLSDGRTRRVQGDRADVERSVYRAIQGILHLNINKGRTDGNASVSPSPTYTYPMIALTVPDSWTPEGGTDNYRINALHVVEVVEEDRPTEQQCGARFSPGPDMANEICKKPKNHKGPHDWDDVAY